jgi:hypothetical protein
VTSRASDSRLNPVVRGRCSSEPEKKCDERSDSRIPGGTIRRDRGGSSAAWSGCASTSTWARGSPAVRARVEALLAAIGQVGSFLEAPALAREGRGRSIARETDPNHGRAVARPSRCAHSRP